MWTNGYRSVLQVREVLAVREALVLGYQFLLARSARRTAMRSHSEYRILVTGRIAVQSSENRELEPREPPRTLENCENSENSENSGSGVPRSCPNVEPRAHSYRDIPPLGLTGSPGTARRVAEQVLPAEMLGDGLQRGFELFRAP
jgi:hypothetical protein